MILLRLSWIMLLAVALSSCGTSYQPVGDYGGAPHGGYQSTRVNANTFIVSFTGNKYTPKETVNTYLLYRCARLTMENGYDYFVITSSSNSSRNINIVEKNKFSYVPDPAKLFVNTHVKTEYQSYTTSQTSTPLTSSRCCVVNNNSNGNDNVVSSFAVIKMYEGSMPAGLPNAFSATDVIAHLGPAVS